MVKGGEDEQGARRSSVDMTDCGEETINILPCSRKGGFFYESELAPKKSRLTRRSKEESVAPSGDSGALSRYRLSPARFPMSTSQGTAGATFSSYARGRSRIKSFRDSLSKLPEQEAGAGRRTAHASNQGYSKVAMRGGAKTSIGAIHANLTDLIRFHRHVTPLHTNKCRLHSLLVARPSIQLHL